VRTIPPSLKPSVLSEIDERLSTVASEHDVRIPWAIESGSRAWGFPSPDSDYDCRFIYVRPRERYLSLWPERDVIETPLDAIFDVNGWDLTKAVRLITKGNATAIEWLRSPIVYTGDAGFRDRLLALASDVAERAAVGRHYRHVALQQRSGPPSLKRFFYVLRPAAALRWLAVHTDEAVPPMDLPTLLSEGDVSAGIRDAARDLIALKAQTRELGSGEAPEILQRFVRGQLDDAERFETMPPTRDVAESRARADAFFRAEIG
jgi:predicted nucleotidyltransferase